MNYCQTFIKRVKGLIPLLFLLLSYTYAHAFSFADIVFKPASAEFIVEDKKEKTNSNQVQIRVKVDENQTSTDLNQTSTPTPTPTISFYKYDSTSDDYLEIEDTEYQKNEEVSGSFNPMTPLILEDGQELDISKKIPAIKCQVYKKREPLIIVYQDINISKKMSIKLKITTKDDKEIVKLKKADENSTTYIGYINTTDKCLKRCDGKLYVKKGTKIDISTKLYDSNKRSRSIVDDVISATASVEVEIEKPIKQEIKPLSNKQKKASVWVSLQSTKQEASKGEFVKYNLTITNDGEMDLTDIEVSNQLSNGLIYEKNSFYKDESKISPTIDNNGFKYSIKSLQVDEKINISFIASIDILAKDYVHSHSSALFNKSHSNDSKVSIKIRDDFDTKTMIIGRVLLDSEDKNISLDGVLVYLENGTFVYSDKRGKFHFDDVTPSSHVVSIDPQSIEDRFTLFECKQNARMMGSKSSIYINSSIAHIQKVNFCLKKSKNRSKKNKPKIKEDIKTQTMPEFNESDLKKAKKEPSFLWPPKRFVPDMPTTKVAFLHKSSDKVVLHLNGKKVDLLNFDGYVTANGEDWKISRYRGVDLIDGDNILSVKIGSKTIKRKIHLSTTPVRAKLIKEKSYLKADGKNSPTLAIQLFDSSGYPLRAGMVGDFSIESPYISQDRLDLLKENPLSLRSYKDRFTTKKDGIAYIKLKPTTTSGEVKLHFPFQNQNQATKAWLSQSSREWFVVGFAEGDIGYKTIKDNLKKTTKVTTDKKVSFFAKGDIGFDTLLTIAYDSGKKDDGVLPKEIDPQSQYTIYADETLQNSEAPSSKKLYLKIEKDTFYALFGTYDTGFNEHELSRYSRRLNGIKSEFKGEVFDYSAFISQSDSSYFKDEIKGDGTSGIYHLKHKDILFGSEKITIQTRDRFRDNIIVDTLTLNSGYDYTFDYRDGTIYFKEPILSRDSLGNSVFIIAEYELRDNKSDSNYDYGARVATRVLDDKLEVGATAIYEQNRDITDNLYAIDAKAKLNSNIIINAQIATSSSSKDLNKTDAKAYLIEAKYNNNKLQSSAYYKRVEDGFGLKQQSSTQNDSIRYGVDAKLDYWRYISLRLAAFSEESISSDSSSSTLESMLLYQKDSLTAGLGYRYIKDNSAKENSSQILTSISKRFLNNKLKLLAGYDFSIDNRSDIFPDRVYTEASYILNQYVELFLNHEILTGLDLKSNQTRAGVKGRPWRGATIESSVSNKFENDSDRVFSNLGFFQGYQLNQEWYLNGSLEMEKSIKGENTTEDFKAYSLGINYTKDIWSANIKAEYRDGEVDDKINLDLGLYTEVNENLGLAFKVRQNSIKGEDDINDIESELSFAYRPDSSLSVINKVEYNYNKSDIKETKKLINTLLLALSPTKRLDLLASYGIKYNLDFIDDDSFDTILDSLGVEAIYDLSKKLEVGLHLAYLHSYKSNNLQENLGAHIGYNLFKYTYLAVGYNFSGFVDDDLGKTINSNEGPYLRFRIKYDNESLKETLNFFSKNPM